jgi:hypothetical protein
MLLLDEAQNYAVSATEDLRMLLGLNLPEQPAFALILVGDAYLDFSSVVCVGGNGAVTTARLLPNKTQFANI